MKVINGIFCTLVAVGSSSAFANPPDLPTFNSNSSVSSLYVGATISRLTLDSDIHLDNKESSQNAFKLFSGIRFNSYVALEAGVITIDEFQLTNHVYKSGSTGVFSKVLIGAPLAENFHVYGILGVNAWLNKDKKYFSDNECYNQSHCYQDEEQTWLEEFVNNNTTASFTYGLGAEYAFGAVAIRAEYERFSKDSLDHNLFNVGVVYRF